MISGALILNVIFKGMFSCNSGINLEALESI